METKILIVGGGGIGSFLSRELNRLIINEQINLDDVEITIADFDKVELKNLLYQNFETSDLNKNKARVLGEKYCFNYLETEITRDKQLEGYDFIISCVDNAKARKLIFDCCYKNNVEFIDLRAESRAIAIFTKKKDKEKLMETLDINKDSSSCQLKYELDNNIIQNGNLIVAVIGSQLILNHLRGEKNLAEYRYYI